MAGKAHAVDRNTDSATDLHCADTQRDGNAEAASHDLVQVDRCLLAAPELEGAIAIAQAWVASLRTRLNRLEIASVGPDAEAGAGT